MCGRFTLTASPEALADLFSLVEPPKVVPRYNIAPTQLVAAVRLDPAGKRNMGALRWGLIPSWADDPKIGYRMINAKSETAATKPSFRSAFRHRHCLIPADGFFEWKKEGKERQPLLVRLKSGQPFAFAGLWENWESPEGEVIESCTILTTEANELLRAIHDRMPVILDRPQFKVWLDPKLQKAEDLQPLLQSFAAEKMHAVEVNKIVNNARNEDPRCVEPIA